MSTEIVLTLTRTHIVRLLSWCTHDPALSTLVFGVSHFNIGISHTNKSGSHAAAKGLLAKGLLCSTYSKSQSQRGIFLTAWSIVKFDVICWFESNLISFVDLGAIWLRDFESLLVVLIVGCLQLSAANYFAADSSADTWVCSDDGAGLSAGSCSPIPCSTCVSIT